MTAQQIDALRDIVNKARVTAICKKSGTEIYSANTEAQQTRVQRRTVRIV